MNSVKSLSQPSSIDFPEYEASEPAGMLDFLTTLRSIKKDLRQKRYLRVYSFLQHHRPASEQHFILYYEVSLHCVVRIVRTINLRKEGFEQLDFYCEEAMALIRRSMEQMRCEGSVLLGRNAVKQGIQHRMNRLWEAILDLCHDLAIGYRLTNRNKEALRCLKGGERLASELKDSLTRNVKILGKIVKLKLQLGVLSLELASPQDALGYLEQALQVAKGELAIRTHDKNIESFVCSNQNASVQAKEEIGRRRELKAEYVCKKNILILFIVLALVYESIGAFDVVAFLILQARKLLDEFKFEKNDGITKTLEKLESQQFIWRFEKHAANLEQLSAFCHHFFELSSLQKAMNCKKDGGEQTLNRKNSEQKEPRKLSVPKNRSKLTEPLNPKLPAGHFQEIPECSEENPRSENKIERPLIPQIISPVVQNNSKFGQYANQVDEWIQGTELKDLIDVDSATSKLLNSAKASTAKSVTMSKLVEELLKEVGNVDQQTSQEKTRSRFAKSQLTVSHKRSNSITDQPTAQREYQKTKDQSKQGEASSFVEAYLSVTASQKRFKPFEQVETQLRSLSVQLRRVEHEIDFERTRIKSRGRPLLPSCSQTPRTFTHMNSCFRKGFRFGSGATAQATFADTSLKNMNLSSAPKAGFQRTSTNVEFQQIILKHKEIFKLHKLEIHCLKNRESKPERLRRNGRKVSYQRNAELFTRLNVQSQARIQELLSELRVCETAEQGKSAADKNEDGLLAFRKTSNLLLSYKGAELEKR